MGLSLCATPAAASLTRPLYSDRSSQAVVAPSVPLLLHFPVACHTVHADPAAFEVRQDRRQPQQVILLVRPQQAAGTWLKVNVLCAAAVRVSLSLQVGTAAAATSRIDFVAPTAALAAPFLPALLRASAAAFVDRQAGQSGRDGPFLLHADALRRVGPWTLLDLRLQNRGAQPLRPAGLQIQARAGDPMPVRAFMGARPAADADPEALEVLGWTACLAPGASVEVHLGFRRSPQAGPFRLRAWAAGAEAPAALHQITLGPWNI